MQQPVNLIEILIARAEHRPEDIAFSYLDNQCNVVNQLSNQQLHIRSAAIAGKLQQIASPSDRVLLLFPQGLEFIYAFIGVMYSGAIPVITAPPRDIQYDDDKIHHIQNIVEETNSNIVLTSESILNEVVQTFFKSTVLSEKIFLSVEAINDDLMDAWIQPLIDNNSIAYLQRTSAKEEVPKFAMISHDNIKNTHERIKSDYQLTASSRSVNWLPHYHYLGLSLGIIQPLYCGYSGYIYSQFDFYKNPLGWLDAMTKYEATFSGAPNFAYSLCAEQSFDSQRNFNLSTWNTAYNSGEPIKKETMERFLRKFSFYGLQKTALVSIYGLAESAYVTSGRNYTAISRKSMQNLSKYFPENSQNNDESDEIMSCGLPASDTQVTIVIPGNNTKCVELELGEILVSNVCNATGYWNKSRETTKIFNIYLGDSDDEPYLRTGDLGFMNKGEIYVVSKIKDDRKEAQSTVDLSLD